VVLQLRRRLNYDYQVTLDESRGQAEYNYRPEPGLLGGDRSSQMPGYSCFLREGRVPE
jgi:hypothetical protein